MEKVWFRKQTGWWYASIKEAGSYHQIKLVKAPDTRDGRKLAEGQLVQELAARQHAADATAEPGADVGAVGWVTVAHVVTAFLKHSQAEHEAPTARWYRDLLPFREKFGKLRVTRLRKKHVNRWVEAKGYNPTSANKAIGALKRAFNCAVEEEHLPKNPIAHVRKPRALTRDRTLTPDERTQILAAVRGPTFRTFMNLLTLTGCRPGEVARVTAADGVIAGRGRGGSTGAGRVSDMRRLLPREDRRDGRTSRPTPGGPTSRLLAGRRQIATVCQPRRYCDGFQWSSLVRFLDNARFAIDNGAAERAIRPIAVGRANWLQIGGDGGLPTASVLLSVCASARRNGLDPWAYLRDVLDQLAGHTLGDDGSDLLPDTWAIRRAAITPT